MKIKNETNLEKKTEKFFMKIDFHSACELLQSGTI